MSGKFVKTATSSVTVHFEVLIANKSTTTMAISINRDFPNNPPFNRVQGSLGLHNIACFITLIDCL